MTQKIANDMEIKKNGMKNAIDVLKGATDVSNEGWLKVAVYPLVGWLTAQLSYLGITLEVMALLSILLAIDTMTGAIKAYVMGQNVKSKLWKEGIVEKGSILALILTLAILFRIATSLMGVELNPGITLNVFIALISVGETYSIFGNFYTIRTKKEVDQWDAISALIRWVMNRLKKFSKDKTDEQ